MSVETGTTDLPDTDETPVVDLSESALETVLGIRSEEDDPENLQLRIEVTGVAGVDYTYDLAFEESTETDDDDIAYNVGVLRVVIPSDSVDKLRGSVLDLPGNPVQGGLVLRNPNRPNPLDGVGSLELTGDLANKVQQLLDQLVGVDDDNRVFVNMGGGCQGCALSQATLVEGITKAITDAIPEVAEVVDATDHNAGANPYY